ncbi:MAG: ABC-ATPase UvrA [Proteobacteria bacterium]|nr:ABC-ATPase UvrA [Pseudomonadota bacterium]
MALPAPTIEVRGACEHNLRNIDASIDRGAITVITGVSGSGKSSLAFDTVLAEAQRRFFYTLSHYSRQFLDLSARPAVRSLTGLSPAVALAQNETQASRRATVGTLTDLSELLAVLLARHGEQSCPTHGLPTLALTPDALVEHIERQFAGQTVVLCAPVVTAKQGIFKKELTAFAARGFLKAHIDGEVVPLTPLPVLAKADKHTIKLIIDYIPIKPAALARLKRAVDTALSEGQGFVEVFATKGEAFAATSGAMYSTKGGCPQCAFSWPRLDSRHFSANSLGQCPECLGLGFDAAGLAAAQADDDDEGALNLRERTGLNSACVSCQGTGLAATLRGIRLLGRTPQDLQTLPLSDLLEWLRLLVKSPLASNQALLRVATEAAATLQRINEVGLGYLMLARRMRSLSGGEAQRLKLAGILAENLRGVLYVLDEPSQGLHPLELDLMIASLQRLKAAGNTVLIVDHDEQLMRAADWIIDLGPGGGARGGRLMAKFKPAEAAQFVQYSVTAKHLAAHAEGATLGVPGRRLSATVPAIVVEGSRLHNLRIDAVRFPLGAFTVVTGVSGAGKSSLVMQTLYPNAAAFIQATGAAKTRPAPEPIIPRSAKAKPAPRAAPAARGAAPRVLHCRAVSGLDALTNVSLVDRRPIAKSSVSMPVSYLEIMGELRDLYAAQPDAQVLGLTARAFSLSVEGGRCPECKGRGELSLTMRFLADARVRCPVCKGARFQSAVLGVSYLGLSLSAVLELTLDEALEHFKNHRKIVQRLTPAVELGLGYLKLGQPSASLSGGEAQRLKLVPFLTKRLGEGSLIILDEPTTGLHFEDVERLLLVLRRLVEAGATVVTSEHHPDVIQAADWVIELGPGSAAAGGKVIKEDSNCLKV